jgi:hypothetical protein
MFITYPTNAAGWAQVYPDIAMPAGYFDDWDARKEARAQDYAVVGVRRDYEEMKRQLQRGEDPVSIVAEPEVIR